MTSELEVGVEAFFRKRVMLLGGYVLKLAPMEAGVPDRLVVMPGGRMFLVELKRDDTDRSAIQIVWHQKLARLGVTVHTVKGREGTIRWLRHVVETADPQNTRTRRTHQG